MSRIIVLRANHLSPDPRVERLVYSLVQNGHEVEVLGWDREQSHDDPQLPAGVRYRRCLIAAKYGSGVRNLLPLILFQFWLAHHCWKARRQFDIVHACDLSTGFVGLVMARLLRRRLVYDIFDFYVDAFPVPHPLVPIVRRVEWFVIQSAEAVILPTEERLQQIHPARPRRCVIVENTPRIKELPEEFPRASGQRDGQLAVVYVGVLEPRRGLEIALSAVEHGPDSLTLHVGGFGSLEALVREVAARCERVVFYGRLSHPEAMSLQKSCDVMFALYDPEVPNHRFSAPNKYYEALLLGRPIVVARHTGVDELAEREGFGLVAEYGEEAFREVLLDVLNSSGIRESAAQNGPLLYERRHSWTIMEERLRELYSGL